MNGYHATPILKPRTWGEGCVGWGMVRGEGEESRLMIVRIRGREERVEGEA